MRASLAPAAVRGTAGHAVLSTRHSRARRAQYPAQPGTPCSVPGTVGCAVGNPAVHGPDAVGERDASAPAKVALGMLHRYGAALQFAGADRGELRVRGAACNLADLAGQFKHADLDAGSDVPDSRPAAAGRGEECGNGVAHIHVVAGLPPLPLATWPLAR